jgi:hypothetical protein
MARIQQNSDEAEMHKRDLNVQLQAKQLTLSAFSPMTAGSITSISGADHHEQTPPPATPTTSAPVALGSNKRPRLDEDQNDAHEVELSMQIDENPYVRITLTSSLSSSSSVLSASLHEQWVTSLKDKTIITSLPCPSFPSLSSFPSVFPSVPYSVSCSASRHYFLLFFCIIMLFPIISATALTPSVLYHPMPMVLPMT